MRSCKVTILFAVINVAWAIESTEKSTPSPTRRQTTESDQFSPRFTRGAGDGRKEKGFPLDRNSGAAYGGPYPSSRGNPYRDGDRNMGNRYDTSIDADRYRDYYDRFYGRPFSSDPYRHEDRFVGGGYGGYGVPGGYGGYGAPGGYGGYGGFARYQPYTGAYGSYGQGFNPYGGGYGLSGGYGAYSNCYGCSPFGSYRGK